MTSSKIVCTVFLFLFLGQLGHGQQLRDLRRQAENFMNRGLYWDALSSLEEYVHQRPEDTDVLTLLAKARRQTNDYAGAIETYKQIIDASKKIDPEVSLSYAQVLHIHGDFKLAVQEYKGLLGILDDKDPHRDHLITDIKRCAVGLRQSIPTQEAIIENMGAAINSRFDEIMPVESPNYSGRMYFSSGRHVQYVDDFDRQGNLKSSRRLQDFDMMASEIINGAWSTAVPLNVSLNSNNDELLFDFTAAGQVAVFARADDKSYDIFVDTFNVNTFDQFGVRWESAVELGEGFPQGLHFFNDSVAVFASNEYEGLGGYDLYLALRQKGEWLISNLGPEVNSQYDEVSPFLAHDGRTLYYSSNGISSMGGFDIFKITYEDERRQWRAAVNLGLPMNSGADDLFFRPTQDGSAAFFSSNRSGTKGGFDLYSTYYQTPLREQIAGSIPPSFHQVPAFQLFRENLVANDGEEESLDPEEAPFAMPALYFRENNQVITPQNGTKLQKIVGFVKTYPHVQIEIVSHSAEEPTSNFDLYFSTKRAEQVAQYLVQNGVRPVAIDYKGVGGTYPLAKNQVDGGPNEAGQWFNRRLDILVHNREQLPFKVTNELPAVSTAMAADKYHQFMEMRKGLYYRVRFATLDQMYKGDLTTKYADPMMSAGQDGSFHYYTGIFGIFSTALERLSAVKSEGFEDAVIVPFVRGKELEKGEISTELLAAYPDLKEFILYIN
ncbi:MAG: OmpA family protein [Saprospiraceae bacterium]|nr:OmpA family protein [Saprospiraceae bacterium]